MTPPQPQFSICNLFQLFPFRCVEFCANVVNEKAINEPNVAALASLNKRKAQAKTFLPSSTLISLPFLNWPKKQWCVVERADPKGPRSEETWMQPEVGHLVFARLYVLVQRLEGPGNRASMFSALNHLNLFN